MPLIPESQHAISKTDGTWGRISKIKVVSSLYAWPKIHQTKMLVTFQRFGEMFLFVLVWQYSSVQTKYNKDRFKVMATYLQQ